LEEIGQAMNSMTTQEDFADSLKDPENAQRFNSLVEDIRYALMDYRVCVPRDLPRVYLTSASDFETARSLRQRLPGDCEF